ncbi:MAG: YIP1 family protein [bacterium]
MKIGEGNFLRLSLGMVTSPIRTLESSREANRPWWPIPLSIGLCLAAIDALLFSHPNLLYLRAVDIIEFDRVIDPESELSLVEAIGRVRGQLFLGIVAQPIAIFLKVFAFGVALAGIARALGERVELRDVVRIVSCAQVIPFLGFAVGLIFLLYGGFDAIRSLDDLRVGIGLNLFANFNRNSIGDTNYILLRNFDLFGLWFLAVVAGGMASVNNTSKVKAFVAAASVHFGMAWLEVFWFHFGEKILGILLRKL